MKRVVLNGKNSLFVGNPGGGRTAAILAIRLEDGFGTERAESLRRPVLLVKFGVGEIVRLCIGESTLPANDEGASSDKLRQAVKHAKIHRNGDREGRFGVDLSE